MDDWFLFSQLRVWTILVDECLSVTIAHLTMDLTPSTIQPSRKRAELRGFPTPERDGLLFSGVPMISNATLPSNVIYSLAIPRKGWLCSLRCCGEFTLLALTSHNGSDIDFRAGRLATRSDSLMLVPRDRCLSANKLGWALRLPSFTT